MNMKYILSIVLAWFLALSSVAQDKQDELIFKAMNDEMERSLEQLKLPNAHAPICDVGSFGIRNFRSGNSLDDVRLDSDVLG